MSILLFVQVTTDYILNKLHFILKYYGVLYYGRLSIDFPSYIQDIVAQQFTFPI